MLLAWIHKRTTGTTNEPEWLREYFKISSAYDPQAICKWYCYRILERMQLPSGTHVKVTSAVGMPSTPMKRRGGKEGSPWSPKSHHGHRVVVSSHWDRKGRAPQRIQRGWYSRRELTWCHRKCADTLPSALPQAFCSPLPRFACRKSSVHRPIVVSKATGEHFC